MTVASTTNRASYTGNGFSTSFSFPYPYRAASDLIVILRTIATGAESLQAITTNYTVSGVADSGTGGFSSATINMVSAPASSLEVHIIRLTAATQSADYTSGGGVDPATLEGGLDRLSQAAQFSVDAMDRALRARRTDPALTDMPSSITRANKVLAFDSSGQPTVSTMTLSQLESASLSAGSVTNSLLANMAQATIKGRASGAGTGSPSDLSGTEVNVILPAFTGATTVSAGVKGAVPAPAAGDEGKFLRGDGAWAAGGGGGGAPTDADYLVRTANGGLTVERVVTDTSTVSWDWGTAGQAKAQIVTNAVGNSQIRQSGALAVVGRSANSTGNVADIQATAATDAVLRESGSTLGFGTIATGGIANDAVTYAKMQNVSAQYRLLGRSTAGAGDPEEITSSANMFSLLGSADYSAARTNLGLAIGTNVQAWDANLDQIAALGVTKGNILAADGSAWTVLAVGTDGHLLTADSTQTAGIKWAAGTGGAGAPTTATYVTISLDASLSAERTLAAEASVLSLTDGGAGGAATIGVASNGITDAKLRQGGALTVIGRSANSTGNVADIAATAASGAVLRESGSTIGFGTIATAGIANDAVTYAKIQNMSAQYTILARTSAGAGDVQELTSSADMFSLLGTANYAAARTALGLAIGTNVQAWDADLDTIAGLSPAKGNIIVGTGAAWTVLTAGTDGNVLTLDSLEATGVKWAAGGGGGGAPTNASYITLGTDATLSAERVLTPGTGLSGTDGGAGTTYTLALNISGLTPDTLPAGSWYLPAYTGAAHRKVTISDLIGRLTTLSGVPASDDVVPIYDTSGVVANSVTIAQLFAGVNSITQDTNPDANADFLLGYDTSVGDSRKVRHRDVKPLEMWMFALQPEGSGTAAASTVTYTFRAPYAFKIVDVHTSLRVHSASFTVTVNLLKGITSATTTAVTGGTSVFTTQPSMTGTTLSSETATPAVMNGAQDSLTEGQWCALTYTAPTGATTSNNTGLKAAIIGYRI